jgi:tetratricopeptide (TPR) repeat protein
MTMTKYLLCIALLFGSRIEAQSVTGMIQQAEQMERQLKESEAIKIYQSVLLQEPQSVLVLCKLAELHTVLGNKESSDKKSKKLMYETAYAFAKRAYAADSNRVESNYVMSMASGNLTDFESDNKKVVGYVRDVRHYADRAVSLQPNYGKAQYVLGKWHYEMVKLSAFKKAAVKLFFGGLPEGEIEKAIFHMEKCKQLEPYMVSNYLDLGRAYKENRNPTKAIEILTQLQKLPNRTSADPILKAAGAELLTTLQ